MGERGAELWDTTTGQLLSKLCSDGKVSSASFTSDGDYLLAIIDRSAKGDSAAENSSDETGEADEKDTLAEDDVVRQSDGHGHIPQSSSESALSKSSTTTVTIDFQLMESGDSFSSELWVWDVRPERRSLDELRKFVASWIPQELIDAAAHLQ
jgi:hypothetical protein